MQLFKKYLLFWPVIAAGMLFFLLGLMLYLISERAMERAPKDANWVRRYRKPGFPFRRDLLPAGKTSLAALIIVPVFAIVFQLFIRVNTMYLVTHRFVTPRLSTYSVVLILVSMLGAAAVYLSLNLLYGSSFAAFWGAMLFAGSPLLSHGVVSLLAFVFLLILLYLRNERPGFPTELLYLAAVLIFGMAVSVCPPAVWLFPILAAVHLYKLVWQFRQEQLSISGFLVVLLVTVLCWLLAAVLAAVSRCFILTGFSLDYLALMLSKPIRIRYACSQLLYDVRRFLITSPRLGLLVNPLVDAPLLGLGIWGAVSAAGMVGKRRLARGWIALVLFAANGIVWLITAKYLLPLGMAVAAGALMKNAELGRRRLPAALIAGGGLVYNVLILIAAWALPLCIDLICRLVRFL